MRRLFIAGNWKMNTTLEEAVALAKAVAVGSTEVNATLGVMPPSVYLAAVVEAAHGSDVAVGAQNMYFEPAGAFTGEISPRMVQDVGATHVILGHSERRHVFGESDILFI
jgi:triosephosphate isomerase